MQTLWSRCTTAVGGSAPLQQQLLLPHTPGCLAHAGLSCVRWPLAFCSMLASRCACMRVCRCTRQTSSSSPGVSMLHVTSARLFLHLPLQASSRRRCRRRGLCARKASGSQRKQISRAFRAHCTVQSSPPLHVSWCMTARRAVPRAQRAAAAATAQRQRPPEASHLQRLLPCGGASWTRYELAGRLQQP